MSFKVSNTSIIPTGSIARKSFADKSADYLYCLVFHLSEDKKTADDFGKKVMKQLLAAGLEIKPFLETRGESVFCLVRAPLEIVRKYCAEQETLLLLDRDELKKVAEAGDPEKNIAPIKIRYDHHESNLTPYESIYAPYERNISVRGQNKGVFSIT